jgi:hypothetical protein
MALVLLGTGVGLSLGGGHRGTAAAQNTSPTPIVVVVLTPVPRATATAPSREDEEQPTAAPARQASTLRFEAADWRGGYYRGDDEFLGRPWTAIYGAQSEYPRATLGFRLDRAPAEPVTVTISGLDDETGVPKQIAFEVNGKRAYEGESWFNGWDGVGNGENAVWSNAEITIPAALLARGDNVITVVNLTQSANFGEPPYVLVAETTVRTRGAGVGPATDLGQIEVEVVVEDDVGLGD